MVNDIINKKEKDKLIKKIDENEPIRLSEPRVLPLEESEWNDEVLKILKTVGRRNLLNIFTTVARHPKLLKQLIYFGNQILTKSSIPAREREILILRIGWLCHSEYEWGQHTKIGKLCGLSDDDLKRIIEGPDAEGWDSFESALIQSVDELHIDSFINDKTWERLKEKYDTKQLIEVVFTVGYYNMVSIVLNTLGIQLDEGIEGFPL